MIFLAIDDQFGSTEVILFHQSKGLNFMGLHNRTLYVTESTLISSLETSSPHKDLESINFVLGRYIAAHTSPDQYIVY